MKAYLYLLLLLGCIGLTVGYPVPQLISEDHDIAVFLGFVCLVILLPATSWFGYKTIESVHQLLFPKTEEDTSTHEDT